MSWDEFYNFLGIKDFIYFISSPALQDELFPVKAVFIFFTLFFLAGVIYFMLNSSWLQNKFLEDVTEFFAWKSYGMREISRRWAKIRKRIEAGGEADYKLAIIDADDFLAEVMENAGYEGRDFQEALKKAIKVLGDNYDQVSAAHETRNSIVYNPDFSISAEDAKKILDVFESAINSIGLS